MRDSTVRTRRGCHQRNSNSHVEMTVVHEPNCRRKLLIVAGFAAAILLPGCVGNGARQLRLHGSKDHYDVLATQIEYPDFEIPANHCSLESFAPRGIASGEPTEYWDLTVHEAIQIALANSQVLRDLGGQIIRSPAAIKTILEPAITETDPRFGVEAALAAFDATYAASGTFQKNDRALNNAFFGGGTRLLEQDLDIFSAEVFKRSATGTLFTFRNNTDYDANNAPANQFPSAWNTNLEAEFRQPLLQGAGVEFNRIMGPNGIAGVPNGVLIARINTDISLADFELGIRDLASNVENAYWDLYFAYRDLDAKKVARDASLDTWRRLQAIFATGRKGGEAEKEAQAREQYFRFQAEVETALTGRLLEGTRTNNGSSGGTFRGTPGVYLAERRLRLIMGISPNDGRLIRPADELVTAKVLFDWDQIVEEALVRRVELRRQRWQVKRYELELVANRNLLRPRLDALGLYRWRGFGKDLWDADNDGKAPFDNAVGNLTNGDFQEWQLGFEMSVPLGFRRAHVAVRNAQLRIARERAILENQELQVVHDLSNSIAELDRAYHVAQTNFNRRDAAENNRDSVQAAYENDSAPLDLLLDAQRRLADADAEYYRSLIEYTLAIKNVHFEKGTLLDFNEIYLSEGPSPNKAYCDAELLDRSRGIPRPLNYLIRRPTWLTTGAVEQETLPRPEQINTPSPNVDAVPVEPVPTDSPIDEPMLNPPGPPTESIPNPNRETHVRDPIRGNVSVPSPFDPVVTRLPPTDVWGNVSQQVNYLVPRHEHRATPTNGLQQVSSPQLRPLP